MIKTTIKYSQNKNLLSVTHHVNPPKKLDPNPQMIHLLPRRHGQRHLPLHILLARIRHDARRTGAFVSHARFSSPADAADGMMLLEGRGEDILADLPAGAVAQVDDFSGVRFGRVGQLDFYLEASGAEAEEGLEGRRRQIERERESSFIRREASRRKRRDLAAAYHDRGR